MKLFLTHGTLVVHLLCFVECTCNTKGSQRGDQCAHNPTGECRCNTGVVGALCDQCDDGYYGFGLKDSRNGCKSKSCLFQIIKNEK